MVHTPQCTTHRPTWRALYSGWSPGPRATVLTTRQVVSLACYSVLLTTYYLLLTTRQVVSLVLVIFAATYPLLACAKASGFEGVYAHWLAPTLSFVVVLSYFGLYEVAHTRILHMHICACMPARDRAASMHGVVHIHHVMYQVARELEDPFIHPPNEAPLVAVQRSFNARLLCGWGYSATHYVLILPATHHVLLTAHCSPPHCLLCSLLTTLPTHCSPLPTHCPPLTTHHSPLTTLTTHHSPLTTHHSLHRWDALDGAYASECVPEGMEGLGLRAVSTAGVEQLETAWRQRNESRGSELAAAGTEWSAAAALPAAAPSLVRARVGVGDASAAQQGDDVALVKLPGVTSTPIGVAAEQPRNSSPSPERLWSSLRSVIVGPSRNSTRNLSPELSSPRRQRTISSTDFKVPRGVQVVS